MHARCARLLLDVCSLLFITSLRMLIFPVQNGYESSPVYTTVEGRKVWVSDGYAASTRDEIVRLALRNAEVRRGVVSLAGRMTV